MLRKIARIIGRSDEIIASIALIVVVTITVAGVFMRYVLGEPFKWTEEVTLALMVWFAYLGSSAAFRENAHISIDFVVDRMSKSLQRIVMMLWHLIMIGILAYVFVWLGLKLSFQAGDKLTPILKISYTIIDFAVVLCGVYSIGRLVGSFKRLLTRG